VLAAVELDGGVDVVRAVAVHAVEHAQLVHLLRDVREMLADGQAALTVLLELEGRDTGFVVEGLLGRGATVHVEEDDALRPRGVVGRLGGERIG